MTRAVDSGVVFVARLALSVLFLWGGIEKMLGYAGFAAYLQAKGVPFVHISAPFTVAFELIGGVMLVIGFLTRPLGLALAAFTLLSGVVGHDFWNALDPALQHHELNEFSANLCIAGGFLLLFVTGAGAISVDAMRAPKRRLL